MTIQDLNVRVTAAGTGVKVAFAFPRRFLADEDLEVYYVTDATGVRTNQVLTTHYTVSGAGGPSGGTVTFLTAPPNLTTVHILQAPVLKQETDYQQGDSFPSQTHEDGLDRVTLMAQRLKDRADRSIEQRDADITPGTGEFDAKGLAISNVELVPTAPDHATSKSYVDALIGTPTVPVVNANVDAAADIDLSKLDDHQGSVATMKLNRDPGALGAEVLATDLEEEIEQIRWIMSEYMRLTHNLGGAAGSKVWYDLTGVAPIVTTTPPVAVGMTNLKITYKDANTTTIGTYFGTEGVLEIGGMEYRKDFSAGPFDVDWGSHVGAGVQANSTWYHVYAQINGSSWDAAIETTAPELDPTAGDVGYNGADRYLYSFYNDSVGDIQPFDFIDGWCIWRKTKQFPTAASSSANTWRQALLTADSAPVGMVKDVRVRMVNWANSASNVWCGIASGREIGNTLDANPYGPNAGIVVGNYGGSPQYGPQEAEGDIPIDDPATPDIAYANYWAGGAGTAYYGNLMGWKPLIPFADSH